MTDDRTSARRPLPRRGFMKLGAAMAGWGALGLRRPSRVAAAFGGQRGAATPAPAEPFAAPPMDEVRIGFVGVGLQGSAHVRNLLGIDGVRITAVCDIVTARVTQIQDWVEAAGQPRPTGYDLHERDFERLCQEEDLDLVYTATPWRWHVPVCLAAMRNGKHAATEVPAAVTIDECWELVETAESTDRHCVMMENVNYGRVELMVLNMVRQGLLGEIMHAECGYLHDLREVKFESEHEGLWRRQHSMTRNGNLYPTHGLGPVANCMNINRGDQFEYLVSMSSNSRGLQLYAREHFADGSPMRGERYTLGDVNVSLIHTAQGRTIFLSHDTNLPRPYSRINLVQGSRGIFQGYPDRVYLEGRSPEHEWEPAEYYLERYEHPLWRDLAEVATGAGHGGMDYMEDYRLIRCLREGLPTDMNVYDAAALSAVSELTERSVADRSRPMEFPDFTRGRWREYPPLGIATA